MSWQNPTNAYCNIDYIVRYVSSQDYGNIKYEITRDPTFGSTSNNPITISRTQNVVENNYEYAILIFTPTQNEVGKGYSVDIDITLTLIEATTDTPATYVHKNLNYNIFVNGIVGNLGIAYYGENYTHAVYFVGSNQTSINYNITNTNTNSGFIGVSDSVTEYSGVNSRLFSIPITGTPNEADVTDGITLNIDVSKVFFDDTSSNIDVNASFTMNVYGFKNIPPSTLNAGDKYTHMIDFFPVAVIDVPTKPHFLKFTNTDSTISVTPSLCDVGVHPVVINAEVGSKNVQQSFDINVNEIPGVFIQPWSRETTICSNTSLTESEKTERRNELVFKNISNKLTKNEKFARAAKGLIKRRSRC